MTNRHSYNFSIGALNHHFTSSSGELYNQKDNQSITVEGSYYKYFSFGFIGSLNVNFIDTETIESGIRFDILTGFDHGYLNCESVQTGIYFGVKF